MTVRRGPGDRPPCLGQRVVGLYGKPVRAGKRRGFKSWRT
jgi:hypothetical protein